MKPFHINESVLVITWKEYLYPTKQGVARKSGLKKRKKCNFTPCQMDFETLPRVKEKKKHSNYRSEKKVGNIRCSLGCYVRNGSKSIDTWIFFVVFKVNCVDKLNRKYEAFIRSTWCHINKLSTPPT